MKSLLSLFSAGWLATVSVSGLSFGIQGCATTGGDGGGESGVDFVADVKPILEERCVMCHNRATLPERTSFENAALAKKGDAQGPVIVPGDADASRLMAAVNSPAIHDKAMPPVSVRVSEEEIDTLRRWIDAGAAWPSGKAGRIVPRDIPLE